MTAERHAMISLQTMIYLDQSHKILTKKKKKKKKEKEEEEREREREREIYLI